MGECSLREVDKLLELFPQRGQLRVVGISLDETLDFAELHLILLEVCFLHVLFEVDVGVGMMMVESKEGKLRASDRRQNKVLYC